MSYIAGLFLLYMDDFESFKCFSNIITHGFNLAFYLLDEELVALLLTNKYY
jgi:hypothetical protein